MIDSQSILSAKGGEERSYDAGKKKTGGKRRIAVDTLRLVLSVVVHGAYGRDYDHVVFVLSSLNKQYKRLMAVFADSACKRCDLPARVKEAIGWVLQPVFRPVGARGFVVLPKRWIVEQMLAWLNRYQRHTKDYDKTTASVEAFTFIAMINLMFRRLAKP